MRHRVKGKKLNRNASHRKAMFRNLVLGLLAKYDADGSNGGRIVTTLPKAKAVRSIVDKLITLGKRAALVLASLPVVPDKSSPEWLKWRSSPDWHVWAKAVAPAVCMRRRAFALLRSDRAVRVLFDDVALRFVDRLGGYTRVIRLPSYRVGDASRLAVLEFAIGSRRV